MREKIEKKEKEKEDHNNNKMMKKKNIKREGRSVMWSEYPTVESISNPTTTTPTNTFNLNFSSILFFLFLLLDKIVLLEKETDWFLKNTSPPPFPLLFGFWVSFSTIYSFLHTSNLTTPPHSPPISHYILQLFHFFKLTIKFFFKY